MTVSRIKPVRKFRPHCESCDCGLVLMIEVPTRCRNGLMVQSEDYYKLLRAYNVLAEKEKGSQPKGYSYSARGEW